MYLLGWGVFDIRSPNAKCLGTAWQAAFNEKHFPSLQFEIVKPKIMLLIGIMTVSKLQCLARTDV